MPTKTKLGHNKNKFQLYLLYFFFVKKYYFFYVKQRCGILFKKDHIKNYNGTNYEQFI